MISNAPRHPSDEAERLRGGGPWTTGGAMVDRQDLRRTFEAELAGVRKELLAFCRHLLWRGEDLEDALQNVLCTAFRRFEEFQSGTSFKAWVFQIASYEILNSNRK